MSVGPRWTTATERALAAALLRHVPPAWIGRVGSRTGSSKQVTEVARACLAALADAGLLVEHGSQTREEWTVEVDVGEGWQASPHPLTPYVAGTEAEIDGYARGIVKPKRKMRRTVRISPWRAVP